MSVGMTAYSQGINENKIIVRKDLVSDTTIRLESITNMKRYDIEVTIRNSKGVITREIIKKGATHPFDNNIVCERIDAKPYGTSTRESIGNLWNRTDTKKEWDKQHPGIITVDATNATEEEQSETVSFRNVPRPTARERKKDGTSVVVFFMQTLEADSYWSMEAIGADEKIINSHIDALNNGRDRDAYIQEHQLEQYVREEGRKLDEAKVNVNDWVNRFVLDYDNGVSADEVEFHHVNSMRDMLRERVEKRENVLDKLNEAIHAEPSSHSLFDFSKRDKQTILNITAIAVVVLSLLVWWILAARKKKKKNAPIAIQHQPVETDSPAIVVRRKTTSILKKQSLDDVVDNKAYLKIECSDFCSDSAVRRMYIKNTCVKEIYNMYAEDLRNPNNPKEDGCMVLGRWVYDDQSNEYYVSLEEIVQPGDDAIFQEYELNFGGKIKLKVAERLRKLRRDSNLQYDLTCWVHSHPGLGVFFSNSDSNVQMQLKHPSHPNFLTAIVVDILTPQQEFGIFTFKHDSTINSKNDLKKMYSLEELHKWAVESDRYSFKADDYYNTLSKAETLYEECKGIQLNNSAIIDICSISTEPNTGLVAWAHGYVSTSRDKKEYIVNSISKSESSTDNDMLGCLVIGTHCSIPSISKAIAAYANRVHFVLFYSSSQETLTTIPVNNKQLSTDEKFYSEEKLEDLKIWTRRKR